MPCETIRNAPISEISRKGTTNFAYMQVFEHFFCSRTEFYSVTVRMPKLFRERMPICVTQAFGLPGYRNSFLCRSRIGKCGVGVRKRSDNGIDGTTLFRVYRRKEKLMDKMLFVELLVCSCLCAANDPKATFFSLFERIHPLRKRDKKVAIKDYLNASG